MCVHFHLLQVIKLCVLAAEHVRVACEVVCFTDRPKFYHIALATECFEMAVVVSIKLWHVDIFLLHLAGVQCSSKVCAVFVPGHSSSGACGTSVALPF